MVYLETKIWSYVLPTVNGVSLYLLLNGEVPDSHIYNIFTYCSILG